MKNVAIGILVLLLMGFAAKELISSGKGSSQPEESGYKFYYYPKLNIYYDATQNNFVYTIDGGLSWQQKKPTAQNTPENLGEKVTIYSADPDAWIHNSAHREQYKGVATNYIQHWQDTARFIPVTISRKPDSGQKAKTEKVTPSQEEKKKDSWFNRFKEKLKRSFKKEKEESKEESSTKAEVPE